MLVNIICVSMLIVVIVGIILIVKCVVLIMCCLGNSGFNFLCIG